MQKIRKYTAWIPRLLLYVLLLDISLVFLYPFLYMLVTSFKSYGDLMNVTVKWIPREFAPQNWKYAWESLNHLTTFRNSAVLTLCATAGHVVVCSMVGYGFARYRSRLMRGLFLVVLLNIIVPVQVLIVPQYMLWAQCGLVGTSLPMILPTFFGYGLQGGLFVFLYRQCWLRVPAALEEAASIDGCGAFRTYWQIVFPTGGATTLVCTVLSVVWHWHDYFEPNVYLSSYKKMLLPQMLPQMYDYLSMISNGASEAAITMKTVFTDGVVMAGTALATLPLLILYFIVQRRFMQGIERTGIVE